MSANPDRDFEQDRDRLEYARRAPVPRPAIRLASEIKPAELYWLWKQRLPHGAVTLLVGDPGVGKSLLAADIAARITRGDSWPVAPGVPHQPAAFHHPATVVHATTQDAADSLILSRLTAARADLERIALLDGARLNAGLIMTMQREVQMGLRSPDQVPEPIDRPLQMPGDQRTLEFSLREFSHTHCLILDPVTEYISPGASVYDAFYALSFVAQRQRVAILAIAHLSKTSTNRPIYRVRGSLDYVSAPRSVLLLTADPNDPSRRILHQIKSNYGPLAPPLSFRVVNPPPEPPAPKPGSEEYEALSFVEKMQLNPMTRTPRLPPSPHIVWEDEPIHDLPPHLLDVSIERQSALTDACNWLCEALSAGPRPTRELRAEAARLGIANGTLYRAKSLLRIPARKLSLNGPWAWFPPAPRPSNIPAGNSQPGGVQNLESCASSPRCA